ncbi:GPP34 family phosphoprotein [Streptomyces sp. NPDC003717]|uniref:GOLPH3/VPS74 family protein n=1 Tax=Streptomyces sp. NPDC003717 TaxID=3154276 RepID=UPI0033AFCE87
MPDRSLSLPARLCLLAWDPARPRAADTAPLHHLVRAGALADLALRGLLTDDAGTPVPAAPGPRTGDAVLDGLLDLVRASRPRRWRGWVRLRARETFDAVREQLVAEGYVRAEKRRALGVFPSVDHVLARPAAARALREEARDLLGGAVPAGGVSGREAALAVLAAAALPHLADGRGDRDARAERLGALTARGAVAAPGLAELVLAVRGAVGAEAGRTGAPAGR